MAWLSHVLASGAALSPLAWAALVVTSFGGALLTFFSGFGLGTILLPVFVLFFPPGTAVAATAVVHLATSALKLGLLWRAVSREVWVPFAVTALPAALGGAWGLGWLAGQPALLTWAFGGVVHAVTPIKLVVGVTMAAFAVLELLPGRRLPDLRREHLALGGLLSGFFGGLTGHQGALRSLILSKVGLTPEAYVATGVALAVLVDLARLAVYGLGPAQVAFSAAPGPMLVGMASAFAGVWVGRRCLHTVTLVGLQRFVAVALLLFAVALGAGLI